MTLRASAADLNTVNDGVDAPRRHRCAKVAVLKDRYEGGARGRG
jgi:hypothetical protein